MTRPPIFARLAAGLLAPCLLAPMLLAAAPPQTAQAQTAPRCVATEGQRQSREALEEVLETGGWTVNRISNRDGCYEVHAFDAHDRPVTGLFDPETLEPVVTDRSTRPDPPAPTPLVGPDAQPQ